MNKKMDKFNETYKEIISEGFFRAAKQLFKSSAEKQKDLNKAISKLLTGNGFIEEDEFTYRKEDIVIKLGKSFKDEKVKAGKIKISVTNKRILEVKQSDNVNDICSKINKALKDAASKEQLIGEKGIDQAAANAKTEKELSDDGLSD